MLKVLGGKSSIWKSQPEAIKTKKGAVLKTAPKCLERRGGDKEC